MDTIRLGHPRPNEQTREDEAWRLPAPNSREGSKGSCYAILLLTPCAPQIKRLTECVFLPFSLMILQLGISVLNKVPIQWSHCVRALTKALSKWEF